MKLTHSSRIYVYSSLEEAENHIEHMIKEGWRPHSRHGLGKHKCIYKQITGTNPYSAEFFR